MLHCLRRSRSPPTTAFSLSRFDKSAQDTFKIEKGILYDTAFYCSSESLITRLPKKFRGGNTLLKEQNGSDDLPSEPSVLATRPARRRSKWLLVGGLLAFVLLLSGVIGWLALAQNSLLVFAGSSDSSLGPPLWHYHSDGSPTNQIHWLSGGTWLAYDSDSGQQLNLVNVFTGRPVRYPDPLSAGSSLCQAQQCSASSGVTSYGRYASEVDDSGSTLAVHLRVWDLLAGDQKIVDYTQAVPTAPKQGFDVVWSPDATSAAVEGGDGWLLIWHAGQNPFLLQGASGNLSNVTWSQNGAYVAANTDAGGLEVWSVSTRQMLLAARAGAAVTFLALSPDGTQLAVATNQQVIQIWNIISGVRQLTYRDATDHTYLGPVWSLDGRHLLSLDKNIAAQSETLRIWDTTNGSTLANGPLEMDSGWSLSPDGHYAATEDPGKGTVRIWDTRTGRNVASHAGSLAFGGLPTWSPDSRELATVRGDNAVQIWNVQTGQTIYTYAGSRETVMEINWSPDGQHLAILTTLLTYGLFDFQHTSAALHGSSITVWRAPH